MRQVDKSNMEKDDLIRNTRVLEQQIMEQERNITFWKVFAMNSDFS